MTSYRGALQRIGHSQSSRSTSSCSSMKTIVLFFRLDIFGKLEFRRVYLF